MKSVLINGVLALTVGVVLGLGPSWAQEKSVSYANQIESLQKRVSSLEEQVTHYRNAMVVLAEHNVAQLERKVAGMQKQITVLHAKIITD